ncbi:unnamed protein product, partial [Heterotrigona itama]
LQCHCLIYFCPVKRYKYKRTIFNFPKKDIGLAALWGVTFLYFDILSPANLCVNGDQLWDDEHGGLLNNHAISEWMSDIRELIEKFQILHVT